MGGPHSEIGDAKFCLIVDETRDESMKEQMAIVLRFVDKCGFVRERFFGVVHVPNTTSLTLKNEIYSILSHHILNIQNIRGQGYDGASNMRGGWNGLQALVLKHCPYAYYIHCFAHRLQLALVAASKEVGVVYCFFTKLPPIVTTVGASCKRFEELKLAQESDIKHLLAINEIESGSGLNQISTLQRPADTRWSSHLRSISSFIKLFSLTCVVLLKVQAEGNSSQRGEAKSAYEEITTFDFVFMLHLMKEIMLITDSLCQALQCKTQDILNAMNLVSSTKELLQKLRDDGWDALNSNVILFCEARNIDISDMNGRYIERGGRARHQQDDFTI
ncbi:hypothetical protein RHMOL_Rhmol11G0287300 [Rhododendron molle]|uniref:Uncharacterized protein n=1 Tax=Rhododendron molle TaxID=49168 RepID=A0ACC0LXE8_RHOML|nr:hypothetical protein RHMOL_Rhmol11G0287300 [Rhododendron molle]